MIRVALKIQRDRHPIDMSPYTEVYIGRWHPLQHFLHLIGQELHCNYETSYWLNVDINTC